MTTSRVGEKDAMTTGYEEQNPAGRRGESSGVSESAKQEAHTVAEHVRSQARDAQHKAEEKVGSTFEEQKGRMARDVTGLASALRKTADELRDQDQENLAVYLRSAANVTGKVAESIEGKDMRDLVGNADDLARREPLLLFAGAAALGFLASRALRTTREVEEPEEYEGREDVEPISPSPTQVVGQGI
jgi:hypothetical protein